MPININDNLRNLRMRERYSMEDVAEIIGVSRQSVAKWENGESLPDIEKCVKLSKLYKVTLDELVSETINIADDDEEKGKYVFGVMKVTDSKIELPEKARKIFNINDGDMVLLLGDKTKGMALVKAGFTKGE